MAEVLDLEAVRLAKPTVVCGEAALGTSVRQAHVGAAGRSTSFLKGGELLLVTEGGLGADDDERASLAEQFAARSIAAVFVELASGAGHAPTAFVDAACAFGVVVVLLRREVSFVDVIESVNAEIGHRGDATGRRREELHECLAQLMFVGTSLADGLAEGARLLGNPLVLEKFGSGIVCVASNRTSQQEVRTAFAAIRQQLPGAPNRLQQVLTIRGQEPWGRLAMLELERALDPFADFALARLVSLFALPLLRGREEQRSLARERGNYLTRLMGGKMSDAEAREQAASMGASAIGECALPIAFSRAARAELNEPAWANVLGELHRESDQRKLKLLAGSYGETTLALVALRSPDRRRRVADAISAIVHAAAARYDARPGDVVICVGAAGSTWTDLGSGLAQAHRVVDAACRLPAENWHDATHPTLDHLLWSLRRDPNLRAFAAAHLEALVEYDEARGQSLVSTLEVFCRHGGRKAEAARALHLERQTLYYRLNRIEEILGVDLGDEDSRLSLHLSLRARRYFGKTRLRAAA